MASWIVRREKEIPVSNPMAHTTCCVVSLSLSVSPCTFLLIQLIHGIVVITQSFGCDVFQKQKAQLKC